MKRVTRHVVAAGLWWLCAASVSMAQGQEAGRPEREAEGYDAVQRLAGAGFTVSFDTLDGEALAPAVLASLDRAYWRVGALLGTFPTQPVSVVLHTPGDFARVTRLPGWAVGAYDGTIRLPMRTALTRPAELDRVLAHELAHALVRSLAPSGVPAWLNEGLATALETDEPGWATRCAAGPSVPPELSMLGTSFSGLSAGRTCQAYVTSARAARRLLDDAGGAAVTDLLRDIGGGSAFEAAFERHMHVSFADFEAGGSAF